MQHAIEAIPRQLHYRPHILFSHIDSEHIMSKLTAHHYFRQEAEIPCKDMPAKEEQQVNSLFYQIYLYPFGWNILSSQFLFHPVRLASAF